MSKSFSVIIPTIGIPQLFNMLTSISTKTPMPDQVIVVIDVKGHSCSNIEGTVEELELKIKSEYDFVDVIYNRCDDWQMNNQTFNIGIDYARNDYVYITHDDVFFPDDQNFFVGINKAIEKIENTEFPKPVIGAVFPGFHSEINVTAPNFDTEGLTQYYSAVSSLLSKRFWEKIGRFDVCHGIWWDAQMQGEMWKHDCWMYYSPLKPVYHYMNRALRANDHAKGWTLAPLWRDCASAYEKVYGKPHVLWGEWYNRTDHFIKI